VLWLPAVVTLAYLPDIVAQLSTHRGMGDGRLLGHSVMFAVAVPPGIAAVLMRLAPVSRPGFPDLAGLAAGLTSSTWRRRPTALLVAAVRSTRRPQPGAHPRQPPR
jgi:hypothetical protein